jgi:epsilon-lactone hydrolase
MPSLRSRLYRPLAALVARATLRPHIPPRARRRRWEVLTALARPPVGTHVEPVLAGGVAAEWLTPRAGAGQRVLFYLHGGGYVLGTARSYRRLVERLARAAEARAFQIEYRLAPEYPFPSALEDSLAAYRWLLQRRADAKQVVIGGDSAGGGLALATLMALRDAGEPLPAAGVVLSPWTDLAVTGASVSTLAHKDPCLDRACLVAFARAVLGNADSRTPLASPLYGDLRGLPPLLVQVGTDEVLHDDAARVVERAAAAGVRATLEVWPDMWHVWQLGAGLMPEADDALAHVGAFIRRHVTASGQAAAPVHGS